MLPIAWAPASPSHLIAIAVIAVILALAISRVLSRVGFGPVETVLVVVAAPLLSTSEMPWAIHLDGSIILANVAGFLIPVLVGAWALASGRAPVAQTLTAVSVVALVTYPVSIALPDEGILLFYRIPALAAGVAAVVLCWRRWTQAGLVAFVAGAGGVILGADLARLPELLAAEGGRRIVLGGAGIFDGIFLVGVLGALVVVVVAAADRAVLAYRKPARAPAPAVVATEEFTWLPEADRAGRPHAGGGAD